MATQNEGMDWLLRTKLDGAGLEAAQRGLKQTGDAAKGAKGELESLGYSAEALKKTLLEVFAFAELMSQFKEGAKDVMTLEQAYNELERSTKRFGQNNEEVKKGIEEFGKRLAEVAGIADEKSIPALVKMYSINGDLELSQKRAALAADISIARNIDFAEALRIVAAAAGGNVRALREVGVYMQQSGDKTKDAQLALDTLVQRFGGASDHAKGLKVELDRLGAAYDDQRTKVVESILPAFAWLAKAGATTASVIGNSFATVMEITRTVAVRVGSVLELITNAVAIGPGAALKKFREDWKKENVQDGDILHGIWEQNAESYAKIWGAAAEKRLGIDRKQRAAAILDAREDTKTAEERKKLLEQIEKDLAASQVKAAQGSYDKRIAMAKVYELEMKKMLAELERLGIASEANKARVVQIALNQIQGLQNDAAKELLRNQNVVKEELKKINEEILKDEKEKAEKGTALAALEAKEKIKLMKQEHQQQIELANAGIGLLTAVFGESKELAIAQAIINTYEGATKALSQGGIYGAALAAVVIATGLAQVATIASTNPGGTASATPSQTGPASGFGNAGFDNASNDRAAFQAGYLGGRGWAADQIALTTRGLAAGYADGMRSGSFGTTYNQQRSTVNHNYGGVYITNPNDRSTALQLLRQTDRMRRSTEDARTTARAARTSV